MPLPPHTHHHPVSPHPLPRPGMACQVPHTRKSVLDFLFLFRIQLPESVWSHLSLHKR